MAEAWLPHETHTFVYDGWNPILKIIVNHVAETTTIVRYLWGLDLSETLQGAGGVGGLVAYTRNGALRIPAHDHIGNVVAVVDDTGVVLAAYEYDPFGNIVAQSGPEASEVPFKFSTKYFDSATGLYYYGYRFYAPLLGRWINRDPIEEEGGENLYAFCRNLPLMRVDFLGLWLSDAESMFGNSLGIPVGGDMFGMDWPSQNQPPFFQSPSDNRPNRRIDEFLDGPDFAALKRQLTSELMALCPDKPTRWTGIYGISCCEPEKCRAEAMAIASAYIAALEEAYHRRPWYLPGGWAGNFVINLLHDNSKKPGQNYPEDLDIGLVCGGWAIMAADVLNPIINESSCWQEKYGNTESWSHTWAIIRQLSSGQEIELDPWKSGGSQYRP